MEETTPKTLEEESKMSEDKRAKETAGVTAAPKPESQTVRIEWSSGRAGPAADAPFHKPNQRRNGEVPRGMQQVPVWVSPPYGGQWQYNTVSENSLANGHSPPPLPVEWYATKHILACGGLIISLILLLTFFDRYRILMQLAVRPRRPSVQNTLKVVCQLRGDKLKQKISSKSNGSSNIHDKPPTYSKYPEPAADATPKEENLNETLPFSCIFTSAKGKVPRVTLLDARNDQEDFGQPFISQQMNIDVPTQLDVNDPKKERANLVIEISNPDHDCGCVIGMGVLVDKEDVGTSMMAKREAIPFSITIEQLDVCEDFKKINKTDGQAKK